VGGFKKMQIVNSNSANSGNNIEGGFLCPWKNGVNGNTLQISSPPIEVACKVVVDVENTMSSSSSSPLKLYESAQVENTTSSSSPLKLYESAQVENTTSSSSPLK
jgi:hypothetical protein